MHLDITTTACIRPEIFRRTIESFYRFMLHGYDCRIVINIDPVGNDNARDVHKLVEVCREFFYFNFHARTPAKPDFTRAFLWCWQNIKADYVLHLEDDWELLRDVDLSAMVETLERNQNLAMLRLPMFRAGAHNMKCWNKFLDFNGEFFEVSEEDRRRVGFAGHPTLIKAAWIKSVLPHMVTTRNPEKQLQMPEYIGLGLLKEVLSWRYGVWGKPNEEPIIKDIGREWIAGSGWQKKGNRAYFTEWEKTDNVEK